MIEVSDDQAWADLNDYLGDQQQDYATSIGLTSFTGGEYNTMTAADMAKLLAELYQGKLINTADRNLLYNYMANTTSTNLIQAALPSDATVYHKYGQLWGYLNDAAIVSYHGHDFALVIFTNNTDGTSDEYADQVTLIHAIIQAAFVGGWLSLGAVVLAFLPILKRFLTVGRYFLPNPSGSDTLTSLEKLLITFR